MLTMIKGLLLVMMGCGWAAGVVAQSDASKEEKAALFFEEARQIAAQDAGRTWGSDLYGPMIFADRKAGMIYANENDSAGTLKRDGYIFTGPLPQGIAANTALRWGGKLWTVVLWPLPENKQERHMLMMHELFHQFQQKEGLPAYSPACDHLDKMKGRLLLKLELEALRKAIDDLPGSSPSDLANAFTLRRLRYKTFPGSDTLEHALEFNEGLATYTGFIMNRPEMDSIKKLVDKKVDAFYQNPTFTRSLAYITGYLYGYLLFEKDPHWNQSFVKGIRRSYSLPYPTAASLSAFEDYLQRLYRLSPPASPEQVLDEVREKSLYRYPEIYAEEKKREDRRQAIDAENRKNLVDGPVLKLPNSHMRFSFDPNEVQVLEGYGPVYPHFSATADWGSLEVAGGGALVQDWQTVSVPLPAQVDSTANEIVTPNWTLTLNKGWKLVPGPRKGDLRVQKE